MKTNFVKVLSALLKELKSINSVSSSKNIFHVDSNDRTICFLVLSSYFGIIKPSDVEDGNDVIIQLNNNLFANKNKIIKLWQDLQKAEACTLIRKVCKTLTKYSLNEYQDLRNNRELIIWVCDHLLQNVLGSSPSKIRDRGCFELLNLIEKCQDYLHVNLKEGNYLVSGGEWYLIRHFFTNISYYSRKITFYNDEELAHQLKILLCFFEEFKHYEYVEHSSKDESDLIFNFESARFNHIILYCKEDSFRVNEDKVLSFADDGGTCLIFNLSHKPLLNVKCFVEYETPLMFDFGAERCAFYHKIPVKENLVRYFTNVDITGLGFDEIFKLTETAIKTHSESNFYIELPKEDFFYRKSTCFHIIKRPEDQKHFVWRKISDIVIEVDNPEERLNNLDLEPNRIFKTEDFPSNPFVMTIDKRFYLKGFNNEASGDDNLISDDQIIRAIGEKKGHEEGNKLHNTKGSQYDEVSAFLKKRSLVLERNTVLLQNSRSCFAKITASPESPLCIQKYQYYLDDIDFRLVQEIRTVRINEAYDEQFIIYQIMTDYCPDTHSFFRPEYMLVAPTKEEQHTYYINKRNENQKQYEYIVDEIEAEKIQSLNYSTAKIGEIGFRNFRKLKNLNPIGLSEITMLVGANNSGKSTLVKGLLLILDNIKSLQYDKFSGYSTELQPKFRLDANMYHDLHIGTFNRALSDGSGEDRTIDFSIRIAHFDMKITIESMEAADVTNAPVILISINDHKRRVGFDFDFKNDSSKAIFELGEEVLDINTSLPELKIDSNRSLIASLVRSFANYPDSLDSQTDSKIELKNKIFLKGKEGFIKEIADELDALISVSCIEYIYAHAATQKVLYNYNDKNDYMAQTLHEFYNERIQRESKEYEFIIEWMNKDHFDIGVDYDLISISGEAYQLLIKKSDGNMKSLSDLGMGSNQLVILLLRLATLMHRNRINNISGYRPTIVLEEPEQNLHPKYQSLLAKLFEHLCKEFRFVVETHSEYLIRQSQVIVHEMKSKDQAELDSKNPFRVYYFQENEDQPCYEMLYRPSGRFGNKFGPGFYDEADGQIFKII